MGTMLLLPLVLLLVTAAAADNPLPAERSTYASSQTTGGAV